MNEQWIQAPKIDGNQELAAQFHMSPMAMRLIRSRDSGHGVYGILRPGLISDL